MSAHTPGPWEVATIDGGAEPNEIIANVGGVPVNIAQVFDARDYYASDSDNFSEVYYEVTPDEALANARLIASAPEMLAALERLSGQCERLRLDGWKETDAERNAKEVIAMAKGGAA